MPKKDCLLGPIQIINKATGTAYKKFYIAHNSMTEGKPYDMHCFGYAVVRIGEKKAIVVGRQFYFPTILCVN